MSNSNKVYVIGGGVCPFRMPKSKNSLDYTQYARIACTKALEDADLKYEDVTVAVAAWNYGDTATGHRALYEMGLTGIPIVNTNVNCSAGSCGLFVGRTLLKAGTCGDVCLVVGMEQMERGLSESKYTDRENPVGPQLKHVHKLGSPTELIKPTMNQWTSDVCRMFAGAAEEYATNYCPDDHDKFCRYLADITVKNRAHGTQNPDACIRSATTREKVLSRPFCGSISEAMSAPTADGAAAVIICSERWHRCREFVQNGHATEICAQSMVTDLASSFGDTYAGLCGIEMARKAAGTCYKESGLGPKDVNVVELHDCFSINELLLYEALGFAPPGQGLAMVENMRWRENSEGGKYCEQQTVIGSSVVINPSGGLESKGHPIAATGVAQCVELHRQLTRKAGKRQVPGARVGLQHNFGFGGAAVVTLYRSATPQHKL
ncbi:Nonspecific lipid-transfer protein, putative [Perkinsus marinus ATCC 50983]|uniref:Nonspecific lipid-transfer protein, putative n=1 Tax=Perkinsus marinus (strain ATCC 50983 / TXsc) TaxID=423536 RepID=C5K6J5_PERM5|nr:Nonspecific lipid-transfer protein, putative [Perkinsus marinus ATCC 50983]EER19915.1 Nonspecific lipid-transfer protein, putative [Perkinsus marinus ATCC 50983]|eukprot:XP_002788119.1 Nonspecific lipid-transfer protein, putative [Perkinsus marinus ATCC 50983]